MPDIVSTDIPRGPEVKWYAGGVHTKETITVAALDVSNGYIALTGKAEFGSLIGTVNGTPTALTEFSAADTPATETAGTTTFFYTGAAESDVVEVYYVDIATSTLLHVASCLDVKSSISADVKKAAIHGQATKIQAVGAIEHTCELEEYHYSQDFVNLVVGNQMVGTPATGNKKLTTRYTGFKVIGCLVGKRYDAANNVTYKWFMNNVAFNGLDKEFPTEDFYKDSVKASYDWLLETDLST